MPISAGDAPDLPPGRRRAHQGGIQVPPRPPSVPDRTSNGVSFKQSIGE